MGFPATNANISIPALHQSFPSYGDTFCTRLALNDIKLTKICYKDDLNVLPFATTKESRSKGGNADGLEQ